MNAQDLPTTTAKTCAEQQKKLPRNHLPTGSLISDDQRLAGRERSTFWGLATCYAVTTLFAQSLEG